MSSHNSQIVSEADPGENFDQLLALLVSANDEADSERRQRDRFPIFGRICVVPATPAGQPLPGEMTVVMGRDMSATGISFSHEIKLSSNHILLELSLKERAHIRLLAEVLWSRPTPLGLFETGCRLIRKLEWQVDTPRESPSTLIL